MNIKTDYDSDSEFDSPIFAAKALQMYNEEHNIIQDYNELVIVDVGAGQPFHYSNTHIFRKQGSTIIAIEPIKRFCEMFTEAGYEILNYAACEEDFGEILFQEYPDRHSGLSCSGIKSISSKEFGDVGAVNYMVPALTLNTILQKHYPEINQIDILDLDTEGSEMQVLKGLDMQKYKPKVIIMENIDRENKWIPPYGYHEFYEPLGYELKFRCAHNDILLRK